MNAAAAEQALFGDALTCEERRPAAFQPGAAEFAAALSHGARGESLLRALALVEDGGRSEDPEQGSVDHALHRLEAKLDLLTGLVANLGPAHDHDPLQALRWSARGARLQTLSLLPVGTPGRFRVQPADWLPSPLVLPAEVVDSSLDGDGLPHAWLRFSHLSPALEAALERHLFRIHRRGVAESRRPR